MWCGRWLLSWWFRVPPFGVLIAHVHEAPVVVAGCPGHTCVVLFSLSGCLYASHPLCFFLLDFLLCWESANVLGGDVSYPVLVCEDNFDEIVRLRGWHSRSYWLDTRLCRVQGDILST